jgi:hypothetical protein
VLHISVREAEFFLQHKPARKSWVLNGTEVAVGTFEKSDSGEQAK